MRDGLVILGLIFSACSIEITVTSGNERAPPTVTSGNEVSGCRDEHIWVADAAYNCDNLVRTPTLVRKTRQEFDQDPNPVRTTHQEFDQDPNLVSSINLEFDQDPNLARKTNPGFDQDPEFWCNEYKLTNCCATCEYLRQNRIIG